MAGAAANRAILPAMNITCRPTHPFDVAALPAIERAAARRFRQYPELAWLADSEVLSSQQHLDFVRQGLSWLAIAENQPVGFILAEAHRASLFIAELSVHLAWQGHGIGRELLRCAIDNARERGFSSLTLTTFRDVPWNAPFYARMGFEYEADEALAPELQQKRAQEAAHGLAFGTRCAMRLRVR